MKKKEEKGGVQTHGQYSQKKKKEGALANNYLLCPTTLPRNMD